MHKTNSQITHAHGRVINILYLVEQFSFYTNLFRLNCCYKPIKNFPFQFRNIIDPSVFGMQARMVNKRGSQLKGSPSYSPSNIIPTRVCQTHRTSLFLFLSQNKNGFWSACFAINIKSYSFLVIIYIYA